MSKKGKKIITDCENGYNIRKQKHVAKIEDKLYHTLARKMGKLSMKEAEKKTQMWVVLDEMSKRKGQVEGIIWGKRKDCEPKPSSLDQ